MPTSTRGTTKPQTRCARSDPRPSLQTVHCSPTTNPHTDATPSNATTLTKTNHTAASTGIGLTNNNDQPVKAATHRPNHPKSAELEKPYSNQDTHQRIRRQSPPSKSSGPDHTPNTTTQPNHADQTTTPRPHHGTYTRHLQTSQPEPPKDHRESKRLHHRTTPVATTSTGGTAGVNPRKQ